MNLMNISLAFFAVFFVSLMATFVLPSSKRYRALEHLIIASSSVFFFLTFVRLFF